MKKRLLALLLTVSMVASMLAVPAGAAAMPFKDVARGDWFHDAVQFVYDEGIMSGMSATEFGPNQNLTRAQAAQLIYNYEGTPKIYEDVFEDVNQGDWFFNAVNWAASVGVVSGMGDGIFAPNTALTREQLVTILMNYAQYKGYDTSATTSLSQFTDAGTASSWAVSRLQWGVAEKLINGMGDGTVAPRGTATRAQMAAIMKNFLARYNPTGACTVNFLTYGGSTVVSQTLVKGDVATEPVAPTKEGATFGAWYSDPEFAHIYDFSTPVTRNTTLYARWNYENYALGEYELDREAEMFQVEALSETETLLVVRLLDENNGSLLAELETDVWPSWVWNGDEDEDEEDDESEDEPWEDYDFWYDQEAREYEDLYDDDSWAEEDDDWEEDEEYWDEDEWDDEDWEDEEDDGEFSLMFDWFEVACEDVPEHFVLYMALKDCYTGEVYASQTSQHFTTKYELFLAKTVNDFDPDQVLNFDEAEDNNFGVLAEDVEKLDTTTTNRYDSDASDPAGNLYVFTNIDSALRDTQPGDILYWPDGDGSLIKVERITISGSTATIAASEDTELSDFYDYLKVDMELDPDAHESVELPTYEETVIVNTDTLGLTEADGAEEAEEDTMALQYDIVDVSGSVGALDLKLPMNFTFETPNKMASATLGATAGLKVTPKIKISWDAELWEKDEFEFKVTLDAEAYAEAYAEVKLTGNLVDMGIDNNLFAKTAQLQIATLRVPFGITGLNGEIDFGVKLNVTLSASVKVRVSGNYHYEVGYSTSDGIINRNTKNTEKTFETKGTLEISFGPELEESINFLNGVVKASVKEAIGVKVKVEAVKIDHLADATKRHQCGWCLSGELSAYFTVTVKLSYEVTKHLKGTPLTGTLLDLQWKLGKCYLSDQLGFAFGSCSNYSYRVDFSVTRTYKDPNAEGTLNLGKKLTITDGTVTVKDESGKQVWSGNVRDLCYLADGNYTVSLTLNDIDLSTTDLTAKDVTDKPFTVDGENRTLSWYLGVTNVDPGNDNPGGGEDVDPTDPDDPTNPTDPSDPGLPEDAVIIASGTCGGNVNWTLTEDGTMVIYGQGAMEEYHSNTGTPWYRMKDKIKELIVREGVTSVGAFAFNSCDQLQSATIAESVTNISTHAFSQSSALINVSLPKNLNVIGIYAFAECINLTGVIVPEGVTSIERSAFSQCKSITSITIPKSVRTIGENAFVGCEMMKSVTILEGVEAIDGYAFGSCKLLTSVTIPASVTSIGKRVFSYCDNLTDIRVDEGNVKYSSVDGILYNKDRTELISCPGGKVGNVTIPNGVTSIGAQAFVSCQKITSVTIPSGVTNIGVGAFIYCTTLKNVTIPSSVTSIGAQAFMDCTELTSVAIPEGVTSIGGATFRSCFRLASVTIPKSMTQIEASAFQECGTLTNVYYRGNEAEFTAISISNTNEALTNATIHYNYTGT